MTRFLLAIAVLITSSAVSCSNHEQQSTSEPEQHDTIKGKQGEAYACPMCPDQISDKPAKCGMCGMDMEKKS